MRRKRSMITGNWARDNETQCLSTYVTACLAFQKESEEWDAYCCYTKHYTSDGNGWRETSDNAHGGLNVGWAFHRTPEYIVAEGWKRFAEEITLVAACWEAERS